MMKILGQRSNELLKICNIIRVHRQGHIVSEGEKHALKNVVKITIAKMFRRALPYIAS